MSGQFLAELLRRRQGQSLAKWIGETLVPDQESMTAERMTAQETSTAIAAIVAVCTLLVDGNGHSSQTRSDGPSDIDSGHLAD